MGGIDTSILIVTALSSILGIWRGFFKEAFSLLTWISALLLARLFCDELSEFLLPIIENSTLRIITAFTIIFISVMVLGVLLTNFLAKLIAFSGLKLTDRLLGGLFGIARGVIIVLLILFLSQAFPSLSDSEQWQESMLIPYGERLIEWSQIYISEISGVYLT